MDRQLNENTKRKKRVLSWQREREREREKNSECAEEINFCSLTNLNSPSAAPQNTAKGRGREGCVIESGNSGERLVDLLSPFG
jgi:hypothetical protein